MNTATAPRKKAAKSDLLETVDFFRIDAFGRLDPERRKQFGQYPTPPAVALYMASMFNDPPPKCVRLLDAGAGVGSLTAAYVQQLLGRQQRPNEIHVDAHEVEDDFAAYLGDTLKLCADAASEAGVRFTSIIHRRDFIASAV